MGITFIRGGVQIPAYKPHYISEKGGGILGNFAEMV